MFVPAATVMPKVYLGQSSGTQVDQVSHSGESVVMSPRAALGMPAGGAGYTGGSSTGGWSGAAPCNVDGIRKHVARQHHNRSRCRLERTHRTAAAEPTAADTVGQCPQSDTAQPAAGRAHVATASSVMKESHSPCQRVDTTQKIEFAVH